MRKLTGLFENQSLEIEMPLCFRQADAVATLEELLSTGKYDAHQVGIFSKEVAAGGKRRYCVQTFAGFAWKNAPWADRALDNDAAECSHWYEVILENRPCWLYFDLEFATDVNPELDGSVAIEAFRTLLTQFFSEKFSTIVKPEDILELASSTPQKFSYHVIVKNDHDPQRGNVSMAFKNNAQVGLVVKQFLEWVEARRLADPQSTANVLFVHQPGTDAMTPFIDTSVYTRNRCFRLLFSSKFGKTAALRYERGRDLKKMYPGIKLLESMATFVPNETPMFEHSLVPSDLKHESFSMRRIAPIGNGSCPTRARSGSGAAVREGEYKETFEHMLSVWDEMRKNYEPNYNTSQPTGVGSCMEVGEETQQGRLLLTVSNNRFCLCKGSSHKSNSIFLVVDFMAGCFYQKCHDADCRHFRSADFPLPQGMLEAEQEERFFLAELSKVPLTGSSSNTPAPDVQNWSEAEW